MARRRGEDHHAVTLPNWTNHDLRRVVRSGSVGNSASRTTSPKPCSRTDRPASSASTTLMNIEDEKREALEPWAQRLASIVNPVPAAPAKVVKLRGRRR